MTETRGKEGVAISVLEGTRVIGRLNPFWDKQMRELALSYGYPFADIKEISINTETGEISVIEKDIEADEPNETHTEVKSVVEVTA